MRLTFKFLQEFGKKHGIKIERVNNHRYDIWKFDHTIHEEPNLIEAYSCMNSLIGDSQTPACSVNPQEILMSATVTINPEQLQRVAEKLKKAGGWGLCGSKWNKTESEILAEQIIRSCAYNHRETGEIFSWASENALYGHGGGGLVDNEEGIEILGGDIIVEPYEGSLTPSDPQKIAEKDGKFLVFRPTQQLLDYVEKFVKVS